MRSVRRRKKELMLTECLCVPHTGLTCVFSSSPCWQPLWEMLFPPFLWTRILRLVIKAITQKYTIRKWWNHDSKPSPFDSDTLCMIPHCLQWAGSSATYYSAFLWTKSPKVLNWKERVIDVKLSISHNVRAILLKPVLLYVARTC